MNVRTNTKAGAACYTVQSGDSLSTISKSFYGYSNPTTVDAIYQSNKATIGANPNYIYAGQKLYIPTLQ